MLDSFDGIWGSFDGIWVCSQVHIPAEDTNHSIWADPLLAIAASCETVSLVVFADTSEHLWLAKAHGSFFSPSDYCVCEYNAQTILMIIV